MAGGLLLTTELGDWDIRRVEKHIVFLLAYGLVALVLRPRSAVITWQLFAVALAAFTRFLQLTGYLAEWRTTSELFERQALVAAVLVVASLLQTILLAAAVPPLFTAARTRAP
jgi:hypothetical protein